MGILLSHFKTLRLYWGQKPVFGYITIKLHTRKWSYMLLSVHTLKNNSLNTQTAIPLSLSQLADNKQFIFPDSK